MNRIMRNILDLIFYLVVFALIQYVSLLALNAASCWLNGGSWSEFSHNAYHGSFNMSGKILVSMSILSSVATFFVFITCKWAQVSRQWLGTKPWFVLAWVVFLALGTILPAQWVQEQMDLSLPSSMNEMFSAIMAEPLGYLAIGVLTPLAEELVFRGAILKKLLEMFHGKTPWIPILISALVFGMVHGNLPQFIHATFIGIILGWMYHRTSSIVPGVVFHWVNNTVAYIMFTLMPQMTDAKLIDLFNGDSRRLWLSLVFSLCIFVPSLFQLHLRLKKD